jgi:hypothetical protein
MAVILSGPFWGYAGVERIEREQDYVAGRLSHSGFEMYKRRMATSEAVMKIVKPKTGQLCTACISLIPGEHIVPLHLKDWDTLKSSHSTRCATLPIWRSFPTKIDEKLERMRTWLRVCQSSHSNCKPKTGDQPTRLIDVGSRNGREPRLVYSNDLTQKHPEYAALSYC